MLVKVVPVKSSAPQPGAEGKERCPCTGHRASIKLAGAYRLLSSNILLGGKETELQMDQVHLPSSAEKQNVSYLQVERL